MRRLTFVFTLPALAAVLNEFEVLLEACSTIPHSPRIHSMHCLAQEHHHFYLKDILISDDNLNNTPHATKMPPRISFSSTRLLAYRPKPISSAQTLRQVAPQRFASDNASQQIPEGAKGPNMDQLPHVSEEQAETDKIMGETPPDISQGTPVKEVILPY